MYAWSRSTGNPPEKVEMNRHIQHLIDHPWETVNCATTGLKGDLRCKVCGKYFVFDWYGNITAGKHAEDCPVPPTTSIKVY